MRLKGLIKSAGLSLPEAILDFEVKGITSDSKKVLPGFIFVAIKGTNFDGSSFIPEAIREGARAVIFQDAAYQLPQTRGVSYIRADNTRKALADLSAAFWGRPSSLMKLVGITGTNGKTTVSYLIEAILKCTQYTPAVIGTINYRFKDKIFNADNTTPEATRLQALLAQMQKEEVDYVIIEVSSHALDQDRVGAVEFSAGIFTNLSVDHLDYHHDLNSYFVAKSKLFRQLPKEGFAILNIDDSHTEELIKLTKASVVTYGLDNHADIAAKDISFALSGTEFFLQLRPTINLKLCRRLDRISFKTSLIGRHNVYNILAAVAFGLTQKIDLEIMRLAIEKFIGVPGRLERMPLDADFSVFIDYAHTEDALRNVIMSLRPLCKGRLYVVFGCGGDRDKTKRPKMGKVVSELADLAIITTDNPRSEEPEQIIKEIVSGIDNKNFRIIVDRRDAIKEAISKARKDDIILIAGKGHENYQIFKDKRIHLDDREVVWECLNTNPH